MKKCWLCERTNGNLERHHIFGGANRKISEKYNLTVYLCDQCHRNGPEAVHRNKDTMLTLHQYGQRKFMQEQNTDTTEFIRIFGKNYL